MSPNLGANFNDYHIEEKMSNKISLVIIMLFSVIVACSKPPEGDFTANMEVSDTERTIITKIYVADSLYRMEQEQGDEKIVVIVDERSQKTRALVPSRKEYLEVASSDPISLTNDPFQGLKFTISVAEQSDLEPDFISGYKCNGYMLKKDGQELLSYWMSPELHFPLKIINHTANSLTLELTNIKREKIDPTLFEIPADYKRMKGPNEQAIDIPPWVEQIESAQIMKPPFEKDLSQGEMIRVRVESERAVRVMGKGTIDGYAALTAVPVKNNMPTVDPVTRTLNLTQGRGGSMVFEESPTEADEIVIRVRDGAAHVEVTQSELPKGENIAAGKTFRKKIVPGQKMDVRIVNVSIGESVCLLTFLKDGKELSPELIGTVNYRTFVLKKEGNFEKRTYSPQGDEILIKVSKGEMNITLHPLE